MKEHVRQSARLRELGISQRAAAQDLAVAATTLGTYLTRGLIAPQLGNDFPDRLDDYLKKNAAPARAPIESRAISGLFSNLGISLRKFSEMTGVSYLILKRGIYQGQWSDLQTKNQIHQEIESRIGKKEKTVLTKIGLSDEHLSFFSLHRDPFCAELSNVDDIIDLKSIAAAERVMIRAIEAGNWAAICGDVGSGKTTLLKKVKAKYAKRREVIFIEPLTIHRRQLGATGLCRAILRDLGTEFIRSRHDLESVAQLVAYSLQSAARDGKKPVILLEESHLLSNECILSAKRLFEFESGFKKLFSIIMVGQLPLARRLRSDPELRECGQRVDLFEINGLNGQVGAYIRGKLERAGCTREIFDQGSLRAIGKKVDTPLSVGNLAAASMVRAADLGEKTVSAAIVESITDRL